MNKDIEDQYFENYYNSFGLNYYQKRIEQKIFVNEFIEFPALKTLVNLSDHKTGDSMLDIGCAFGFYTKYFEGEGFNVTALDSSSKMISIAKAYCVNSKNIEFVNSSFYSFDFGTRVYKFILGSFMLSYFDNLSKLFSVVRHLMGKDSVAIFSMLHPIVQHKTAKSNNGYIIDNYFDTGYFETDFLNTENALRLKRWSLNDIFIACRNSSMYVEEVVEPVVSIACPLLKEREFYSKFPAVVIFKIKRLLRD